MENFLLSFLITMLWSLIFTCMFLGMRKTKILRSKVGISGSIVICIILLLRMAIPFDIGIARKIEVHWPWFLKWYKTVNMEPHHIGSVSLTITQMAAMILGVVAVILVIRFVATYFNQIVICRQCVMQEAAYEAVLQRICEQLNYHRRILLVKSSEVDSPMCIGFRTSYIILPETEFSEKELEYIFTHEITHLKYHDLYYMMAANLLNCIFWWNPLTYVVKTELNYALEVRCDIRVTSDYTVEECTTYLQTILKVLKNKNRKKKLFVGSTTGFASCGYNRAMEERFRAVLTQEPVNGSSKAGFHVWCLGMLGLLACSYLFVVTPYYNIRNTDYGIGQEVNGNDMWLSVNENGEYIIHFWEDGNIVEQIVEEDMIAAMEQEMEVREE